MEFLCSQKLGAGDKLQNKLFMVAMKTQKRVLTWRKMTLHHLQSISIRGLKKSWIQKAKPKLLFPRVRQEGKFVFLSMPKLFFYFACFPLFSLLIRNGYGKALRVETDFEQQRKSSHFLSPLWYLRFPLKYRAQYGTEKKTYLTLLNVEPRIIAKK